ncbi:MAG: hybrid sensor histidine kinase/response regulator [Ramlibacter sp.]|nr:hybrid sensor histidine kinase/response regulator [Ramlibacter sp.]
MRGVLSVLGLDQAAQAVLRMRESVEEILVTEIDEERARAAGTFDKLGNNLGALGFLIDMLNYQPSLAKKLFVYDDSTGELRPLMGRAGQPVPERADDVDELQSEVQALVAQVDPAESREHLTARLDSIAAQAVLAEQPVIAHQAREAAAAVAAEDSGATAAALSNLAASVQQAPLAAASAPAEPDIEEDDLRDIFLEEAREVVQHGLAALQALASNPRDVSELTTLRRAFHTLKGSSRMVGLTEFGEAAWSLEQVLNTWLADQKPADDDLRRLAGDAMRGFGRWTEDIAANNDGMWKAGMFRVPADTMRTEHRMVPFELPQDAPAAQPIEFDLAIDIPAVVEQEPPEQFEEPPSAELASPEPELHAPGQTEADVSDAISFDFDIAAPVSPVSALTVPSESESFGIDVIRAEAPDGIDINFDFDLSPDVLQPQVAVAPEAPTEIEGIDFASLSAVAGPMPAQSTSQEVPVASAAGIEVSFPEAEGELDMDLANIGSPTEPSEPLPVEAVEAMEAVEIAEPIDEQIKVIGSLRIGIPLYNVYLNEADEWSRRLATEVAEWALELTQPVPDSAVGLAHALAGSSATVGFNTLSDIARALESELMRTQKLAYGTPRHGKAFTDAAEEIRRLLHQFAAGFLKEPNPGVIQAMLALKELEIPQRADHPEDDFLDDEFADLPQDSQPAFEAEQLLEPLPPEPLVAPPDVGQAPPYEAPSALVPVPFQNAAPTAPVASVRTITDVGEDEEDIDVADAIDPDLFPIFEEEAVELMPQLGGALRQWAARPDNRSARDETLRVLHTLKGSARLAGALRLGELAHRMESEIEYLVSRTVAVADLEALLHRYDSMQANFDALRATGGVPVATEEVPTLQGDPTAPPSANADMAATVSQPEPGADAASRRALLARPAQTNLAPQRAAANQAVRVRSQLLDRLVNQAGEVMITRSRLESELRQLRGSLTDLTGNLDRLRAQLRDIELHSESQMQSRLAQTKDSAAGFDPLEFDRFTRVQELTRMMAESVNDVATVQRNLQRTVESTEDDLIAQARQTRELQRDLLRTRMVEFEGIADRLYRVIRLASKETGKQVKLDITGGSIEMDRGVLDRMTPAFEHLLRNCVAHGIEDPAARAAAGKDPIGTIVIGLHHEGNDVSVEFRDDGAGLNLRRIREKAAHQGLVAPGQELSDAEAAQLIFMPGFSTAAEVTELSGRGIGMDVVRAEVNALGGRIETSTTGGKGTSFKLVLPLTTAVTQVVMIRSGTLSIGVPANVVEVVRRAPAKEVQQAYNTGFYDLGGEKLPFYWSGALLQSSPHSTEPQTKTLPVVVFRSAAQRIALHVDEVLGNQEVVVKNLGPQLARLPGLAGMTVLASGAVVLIYNPVALTAVYGSQARELSADRAQPDVLGERTQEPMRAEPLMPAVPLIPLILVVDDSITVRRVTQRLLQREGYRVAMAADGLQALERLAEEKPTVVLSDIEMPRMDGFDLARNIRGDARLKDLPIIMITSRIAEKHREHAKELGVDNYLGKPYSEEELLSLVKHYCTAKIGT